jgi:hypothetical protein
MTAIRLKSSVFYNMLIINNKNNISHLISVYL